MFFGMLITNVIGMALTVACTIVASIFTGNYLGADAVAAFGLIQPIILLINAIGMLLSPGLGVMVTRYMGKAEPRKIDQVFSIVMYANIILFLLIQLVLYFNATSIASVLGSKAGDTVVTMTADYIRGFSLGIVPMRVGMIISGVIIIDNSRKLAISGMVLNLVSNIVLAYVNIVVHKGGMYGLGIATTASYIISMFYFFIYFAKKSRLLHFTFSGLNMGDLKDVMVCGIPNLIHIGGQTLRGFAFNAVLLMIAGGSAVASMSVCNSAYTLVLAVLSAILVSTAVLSSMLYGEEDREGIKKTLIVSMNTAYALLFVLMALAIIFARPIAKVFLKQDSPEILLEAIKFIRLNAIFVFLTSGTYSLSGVWQGTNKLGMNYLISILRDFIVPVLASCALGLAFGLKGFEMGFVIAGVLMVIICLVIHLIIDKTLSIRADDLILIEEDFFTRYRERLEMSISTTEEAIEASKLVTNFCLERWADKKEATMNGLFVEEIACNTINYGFTDKTRGSIDIRIIYSDKSKVIRFRDNGKPFNPIEWIKQNHPDDPIRAAGIRIVVGMAKEVRYVPAMGLNNLLVIL